MELQMEKGLHIYIYPVSRLQTLELQNMNECKKTENYKKFL